MGTPSASSAQVKTNPASVTDLSGKPLASDRDLFVTPPPEIGRLISAWSEVRVGETLWPLYLKLALAGVFVGIAVGTIAWFKTHDSPADKRGAVQVIALFGPVVIAIGAVAFALKKKYLAYIGDKGVAVYTTRGTRSDVSAQVMQYHEVADVSVKEGQDQKGRTEIQTRFVGADGQTLISLRGKVRTSGGQFVPDERQSLAIAIEVALRRATGRK